MCEYKVFKKSAGCFVKTLPSEAEARLYAATCNKTNRSSDYTACARVGGVWTEV